MLLNPATKNVIENKEVTILLSDLRGFTAMSETIPAADVMFMLNRYFSKMTEIIVNQFGGTIDKFMGDSIMALFGTPQESIDDVQKALCCAIEMQISMDEINQENEKLGLPKLYMGIGINTGKVVAGEVGSEIYSQYTVIGDEVNLAHRIEAFTLRGQILISEHTYDKVKILIETGTENAVFVKGKRDPITLYELLSVTQEDGVKFTAPRREMRKSHRVEVNLPFVYQHVLDKKIGTKKHPGRIIDISYDGMFVALEEYVSVFSEIKLTISLSLLGQDNDDIYAKVLRIYRFKENYLVNFEFTALTCEARKAIKAYVDDRIQSL